MSEKQLTEEFEQLATVWNMFTHQLINGNTDTGVHPPPAFAAVMRMVIDDTPLFDEHFGDMPINMQSTLEVGFMSIANMFFQYGQLASKNGVLFSNLTPCNCGRVDEDELRQFLEGGK